MVSTIPFLILSVLDFIAYKVTVLIFPKYQKQYASSSKPWPTFVIQISH